MSGLWRCSCCGEAMPAPGSEDSRWRWDGVRYQHKCPGIDPQAGHFDCEWFGDGLPDGPPPPPPPPPEPAYNLDELDRLHAAATPLPWATDPDGMVSIEARAVVAMWAGEVRYEDINYIEAACNTAPIMAADIRRLRSEHAAERDAAIVFRGQWEKAEQHVRQLRRDAECEIARLKAERDVALLRVAELETVVNSQAERVHKQAELLSRRAEKGG